MKTLLSSKKRIVSFIILLLIALSIPVAVFLSQQQQNINPNAATQPDLIVQNLQLVDAGGNTRTTFAPNEDIYVKITLRNQGGATGTSQDGRTRTQIYSDSSSPVPINTPSDVQVTMSNGEFGAGSTISYTSIFTDKQNAAFNGKKSWKKSTSKTYTARAFVNFNNFVTESNTQNNQATIQYTIAESRYVKGTTSTSIPSGFSGLRCVADENNVEPNLTACVTEGSSGGKAFAKVSNTGSQAMTVGLASYKAYIAYPTPYPTCTPSACPEQYHWIWTQTIHSAVTYSLPAGQTVYLSVSVPDCAWQIDVFKGSILPSFQLEGNQWYSGQKTYLDGYYNTQLGVCQPTITTPTPTVSTPTSSPTVTLTPGPSEPTPSPSSCPIPSIVTNVRVTCPYCVEEEI